MTDKNQQEILKEFIDNIEKTVPKITMTKLKRCAFDYETGHTKKPALAHQILFNHAKMYKIDLPKDGLYSKTLYVLSDMADEVAAKKNGEDVDTFRWGKKILKRYSEI